MKRRVTYLAKFLHLLITLLGIAQVSGSLVEGKDDLARMQSFLLDMLSDVHTSLPKNSKYYSDARRFVTGSEHYTDYGQIKLFFDVVERGLAPQNYFLNLRESSAKIEILAVFKLLCHSKDWQTFYINTLWARQHLNEEIFVYALRAVVHKKSEFQGITLPGQNEIFPYYFYVSDEDEASEQSINHADSLLKYFTADVEWNLFNFDFSFNFFNIIRQPESADTGLYFYWHQQTLARYNLELYALDGDQIQQPYQSLFNHKSKLETYNGIRFAHYSPESIANLLEYFNWLKEEYENSANRSTDLENFLPNIFVRELIDSKIIELGHIFSNKESIYVAPSELEHTETEFRNPIYYKILESIVGIYNIYKNRVSPPHTKDDLSFPEVKILELSVTPLTTYFEKICKNVKASRFRYSFKNNNDTIKFDIKQLNHEPFNVTLRISSVLTEITPVYIQLMIASAEDDKGRVLTIPENQLNFFKIDQFVFNLPPGESNLIRKSDEFFSIQPTEPEEVGSKNESFESSRSYQTCGIPNRLILPKGSTSGRRIQFLAIITPINNDSNTLKRIKMKGNKCRNISIFQLDGKQIAFPFDRYIKSEAFSNSNFANNDSLIYHNGKYFNFA